MGRRARPLHCVWTPVPGLLTAHRPSHTSHHTSYSGVPQMARPNARTWTPCPRRLLAETRMPGTSPGWPRGRGLLPALRRDKGDTGLGGSEGQDPGPGPSWLACCIPSPARDAYHLPEVPVHLPAAGSLSLAPSPPSSRDAGCPPQPSSPPLDGQRESSAPSFWNQAELIPTWALHGSENGFRVKPTKSEQRGCQAAQKEENQGHLVLVPLHIWPETQRASHQRLKEQSPTHP